MKNLIKTDLVQYLPLEAIEKVKEMRASKGEKHFDINKLSVEVLPKIRCTEKMLNNVMVIYKHQGYRGGRYDSGVSWDKFLTISEVQIELNALRGRLNGDVFALLPLWYQKEMQEATGCENPIIDMSVQIGYEPFEPTVKCLDYKGERFGGDYKWADFLDLSKTDEIAGRKLMSDLTLYTQLGIVGHITTERNIGTDLIWIEPQGDPSRPMLPHLMMMVRNERWNSGLTWEDYYELVEKDKLHREDFTRKDHKFPVPNVIFDKLPKEIQDQARQLTGLDYPHIDGPDYTRGMITPYVMVKLRTGGQAQLNFTWEDFSEL